MVSRVKPKIELPNIGTASAKDFYSSWGDINRLFDFILYLAGRMDQNAETAHKALVAIEDDEAKKADMEMEWKNRLSSLDKLKHNRQL